LLCNSASVSYSNAGKNIVKEISHVAFYIHNVADQPYQYCRSGSRTDPFDRFHGGPERCATSSPSNATDA
jgi:hypothetical protein